MQETDDQAIELVAIKNPDGTFRFCVDEAYAIDAGIDPSRVMRVRIPRELVAKGSVTQIGEYIATYFESQGRPSH